MSCKLLIFVLLLTVTITFTPAFAYDSEPTSVTCADNMTLQKYWEWEINNVTYTRVKNETCSYLCEESTFTCSPPPMQRTMEIGAAVSVIFIIAGILYSKGGR